MILAIVDSQDRLRLYQYADSRLQELAQLQVATSDPEELAAIAGTLALMAGAQNGSTPQRGPGRPRKAQAPKALSKADQPLKRKLTPGAVQTLMLELIAELGPIAGAEAVSQYLSRHRPEASSEDEKAREQVRHYISNLKQSGLLSKSGSRPALYSLTPKGQAALAQLAEA